MDFLIWSFGSKKKEYSFVLVGVLNYINGLHSVRNTGEIFLIAPAISNPKYATDIDKYTNLAKLSNGFYCSRI